MSMDSDYSGLVIEGQPQRLRVCGHRTYSSGLVIEGQPQLARRRLSTVMLL